jgi:hypothetical protein
MRVEKYTRVDYALAFLAPSRYARTQSSSRPGQGV